MDIISRELLIGPVPVDGSNQEYARYYLRLTRLREIQERILVATRARWAREVGLTHREIGEILGHSEGWARQFLKDTADKKEFHYFAEGGFAGDWENLAQFYADLKLAANRGHKLHLCAEYGLSNEAVSELLQLNPGGVEELMADYRADAAA